MIVRSFSWIGRVIIPGVFLLSLWLVSPVKADTSGTDKSNNTLKSGDSSSDTEQYVSAGGKKDGQKKAGKGKRKKGGPKKGFKGKKGKKGKGKGKGKKAKPTLGDEQLISLVSSTESDGGKKIGKGKGKKGGPKKGGKGKKGKGKKGKGKKGKKRAF